MNASRTGLFAGALLAIYHLIWLLMILTGIAQPVMNFIFWAHLIHPVYFVRAFEPVAALTLIFVTFFSGYLTGAVGAILWNKFHPII